MSLSYFNETGPIYRTEHIQAKEFIKFVRDHVVVLENSNLEGKNGHGRDTAWFDWQGFRDAAASFQASDLLPEHDFATVIPSTTTPITSCDVPDTTIKAILDALVSRFASTFTSAFVLPTSGATVTSGGDQKYFLDTLRKNLYHAFTHHLEASDTPERYLSFHPHSSLDASARSRSGWEYRLLFVHSATGPKTVRGLVMTVTLEGRFENKYDEEEAWRRVALGSRGPFSGELKAMQVVIGERFRCP